MPKKMGTNTKAEAARARKSARRRDPSPAPPRSARRRPRSAEAAARRAENRKIAEQEQLEIDRASRKPDPKANRVAAPVPKVTEAELARRRDEEGLRLEREAEAAKKRQSRTANEEEYERMVLVSNTNRDESVIEAHSVEEAIVKMVVNDAALPPDRHPERRLKASFKAFEEAELARLKEEKPGLSHTQYKDMIWKLWKKSPDNPLNQQVSE
ncbi:hypothetical protein HPP92_025634 [Vanilla planifolia]|uniref:Coiled-coil domain-containing protein n=1 Tax=Vanilla planifolia TaxID=51239 RepID=A0A835UAT1_VANPL|nr:hypothetical protein HPP92_025891 [Vanilla planifolia]KAG0454330.1 hypothetical protein HPP92_025634 [Vanilla planifolia]